MNLSVTVDDKSKTRDPSDTALFNLTVFDDPDTNDDLAKRGGSGAREAFLNVSVDPASPRFVTKVLEQQSQLLRVDTGLGTTTAPGAADRTAPTPPPEPTARPIGAAEVDVTRQRRRRQDRHVRAAQDRHLQPSLHSALHASRPTTTASPPGPPRRTSARNAARLLIVDAPAELDGRLRQRKLPAQDRRLQRDRALPTPPSTSRGCCARSAAGRQPRRRSRPAGSSPAS